MARTVTEERMLSTMNECMPSFTQKMLCVWDSGVEAGALCDGTFHPEVAHTGYLKVGQPYAAWRIKVKSGADTSLQSWSTVDDHTYICQAPYLRSGYPHRWTETCRQSQNCNREGISPTHGQDFSRGHCMSDRVHMPSTASTWCLPNEIMNHR